MEGREAQTTKIAVPKFASFRPKQQTHLEGDDQSQNQAKSKHRDYPELSLTPQSPGRIFGKRHHQQDERPRSKERRPRHHHHVPGNKGKRQGELFEVENPLQTVTERDETSEVFITDVRGDTNNLTYGTIHRYIIPPYLRAGAGNVVGLSTDNKIDRMSNSDKGLIISNRSLNRLGRREKYVFSKNVQKSQRQLRIQPVETPDQSFTDGNDFIPLTRLSSRKRKLREDHNIQSISESSEEEDGNHYRSIEGKAKHRDGPADRDLEYATDSAASDDGGRRTISPDEATKQRGIELTRRVDAQPTNIDAWLDLIAHQDDLLVFGTGGERRNLTNAEKRSIADIKLSMYEKALQKLSKSDRVELIVLGVMEEGSKIWDTKKLGSKWRSVLEEYPGFIKLWTKYLDFQQTNFINFQYEECRTIFLNCLKVLTSISSNVSSAVSKDDINVVRIYILLRLSLFMREAGYTEHALGLWQGILEFNFLQPEKFGLLAEDSRHAAYEEERLASFEEFWESEVSRIGEDGAEGWRTWTEKGGIAADPRTEASKVPVNDEEIFATWVCWERRQALQSRNIARTIDEVEENDPFRVILFPDIRDYLFYVGNARLRFYLLNAFLAFCRLPSLTSGNALNPVLGWREDSLIMNDLLEQSENFISRWYLDSSHGNSLEELAVGSQSNKSAQTGDADRRTLFDLPITSYLLSPDTLFPEKGKWFSNFDSWPSRYDGDNGPIEQAWIRRVLRMLADVGAGDIDLAEYYLAFEWSNDAGSARKAAKSMLKKQPTSLRLYNAYALIVARSGNRAASDHVFGTAINMSKTFAESARRDVILLWRTWIWEYLALGDHDSALKHLLALPESTSTQDLDLSDPQPAKSPSGPTVAALLRVQRALTDGRGYMLSSGMNNHAVLYAECLALLAYLSQHKDISAALEIFRQTSTSLAARNFTASPPNQLLHQAKAKLLHHHTAHVNYFKPALIRSELAESIQLFPTNTIFLSLYAWNEARFRIDDRVRSIMRDLVLRQDQTTIIGWYFSIWTELHRTTELGSNAHSVRATFEKAVDSQSGKSNPALWKLYLLFEHGRGEMQRAKQVFYRGMRACPWAKQFYMLAFTHLRAVLTFGELRAVYSVLGEKELRVHVDLEDQFEAYDERVARARQKGMLVDLPDDGSSDDD